MSLALGLDIALATALVAAAYRAIRQPGLFVGVVLYIVFGGLLAIVWVRLEAPDLAIAEAAIGAGITGAILLDTAASLGDEAPYGRPSRFAGWVGAAAGLAVAGVAGAAFLSVSAPVGELGDRVLAALPASGVEHPVSAVLLNFRGYDTWLEVGVLLVAALGMLGLGGVPESDRGSVLPPAVATGAVAISVPLAVLIAGYFLWRGTHGPGGAFQAGAVLAAVSVLLTLLGRSPLDRLPRHGRDTALVAGFTTFLVVGVARLPSGGAFLEYGVADAGTAILLIELGATLSIATTLALLFAGARGQAVDAHRSPP